MAWRRKMKTEEEIRKRLKREIEDGDSGASPAKSDAGQYFAGFHNGFIMALKWVCDENNE
jgi:hypothetical protein